MAAAINPSAPLSEAAARTVAKIVRTAGVTALWRGNSIAVIRDVPFGAILFSSYALIEEAICGWLKRTPRTCKTFSI